MTDSKVGKRTILDFLSVEGPNGLSAGAEDSDDRTLSHQAVPGPYLPPIVVAAPALDRPCPTLMGSMGTGHCPPTPAAGAGARYEGEAIQCLGSHLGSLSLRIVDVHGRPNRVSDQPKRTGRSVLNCGSLTSKAREGSSSVGSNLIVSPSYSPAS